MPCNIITLLFKCSFDHEDDTSPLNVGGKCLLRLFSGTLCCVRAKILCIFSLPYSLLLQTHLLNFAFSHCIAHSGLVFMSYLRLVATLPMNKLDFHVLIEKEISMLIKTRKLDRTKHFKHLTDNKINNTNTDVFVFYNS